ncbi:MAG: hypothetical protein HOC71_17230 [Candidatus Latescibacteria bacterium]|jgi:hypothetical protein|nr:hypothetical protein [Candidatus Latescibacterota bacterium]
MKSILRLLALVLTAIFSVVAVIKFVKGCSWKEAVGILEELCKECKEACPCCNESKTTG